MAASGLPIMTTASVASTTTGSREKVIRVEQHPDRDEKEHREGVPHG